jgi:hypothetical protein
MFCRIVIATSLVLASSDALACRPLPFTQSAVEGASAVAIGTVTSVAHPELEAQILRGSAPSWPGYALHPYQVRVAVSDILLGTAPAIVEVNAGGCPPPWVPGDVAVIIFRPGEHPRLWRDDVVGSKIRAIVLGAEG